MFIELFPSFFQLIHHTCFSRQILNKHEPVYQAIWAENTDFDEVLISPRMFKDHMPDKVLAALHKVWTNFMQMLALSRAQISYILWLSKTYF